VNLRSAAGSLSGLVERLVSAERAHGRRRVAVLTTAILTIVVIGLINAVFDIALRAFYAIPVVVVTIAVSSNAGILYAALAALAWSGDRAASDPVPVVPTAANAVLRFAGLLALVAIVAILRTSIERTRASERRSREFLGFAAHQLRTPVAGVRASAEALLLTDEPASREELLIGITVEAGRMGRLVTSLLRIARLDQGDALAVAEADVAEILTTEIDRVRRGAPDLEIAWLQSGAPQRLCCDGAALSEMVGNLLDNARRHAARRIAVEVTYDEGLLRIEVADDGPGLPAGQEDRAFERFVSLDGRGGTGLGLPIARALAEAHGGSLAYRDGRFSISIPVASASTR
jgi:signal transduction histidine kinase